MSRRLTTEEFIEKAKAVHGDMYDYSKTEYINSNTRVTIICPIHGEFTQIAYSHIGKPSPYGCRSCGIARRTSAQLMTTEEFIEKAKAVHGDRYDYSESIYQRTTTKIKIRCKVHGEFEQRPVNHIQGFGCMLCGAVAVSEHKTLSTSEFIKKSINKHGGKYDYSSTVYVHGKEKVPIICPTHGVFMQRPNDHLAGNGCSSCATTGPSKAEQEIFNFIESFYDGELIQSDRMIISPLELDIVIPDKKIAIEFNGLFWHNDGHVDKNYHLNKTKACEAAGYQLIHIFENEWTINRNIVESRLRAKLGCVERRIFARKCIIKPVISRVSKIVLNQNHIQGFAPASINYGLYFDNELVSLMTFGKSRYNKNVEWELIRFVNADNTTVVGGASKLFKHFRSNHQGSVLSYSDRRWNTGSMYEAIGFEKVSESQICYWYFKSGSFVLHHRSKFQKHKLHKLLDVFDPEKTEIENMRENGYMRIFDCGTNVYVCS